MEFYDPAFTAQLAPLVTLALGTGPETAYLKTYLDQVQPVQSIWDNSIIKNRLLATKFRLLYVSSETDIAKKINSHKSHAENTHSPISPFNSKSDLFPSGVISAEWFEKYTRDVPFAAVCVYNLDLESKNDPNIAETLAQTRQKYLDYNVRFVAIVVSSSVDVEDRIAYLRQFSGLANLLGLFHLLLLVETLDTECEVLVSSLLNTLKTSATDFYSNIELRVKQRLKKYYTMPRSEIKTSVELLPKILETRNMIKQGVLLQLMHPHNVESSLHFLEQSYENILDLINQNSGHFFSKSRTTHDIKVYVQWRTLLDVITIHLVRGYLSIEESVLAMRRHQAHIGVVVRFLESHSQPGTKLWIATQKQWLAQLLALVPTSILQELHGDSSAKGKKPRRNIEYLGGLLLEDKSLVITSPGLLYKAAANELTAVNETEINSEIFSQCFSSAKDILNYRINLLELAKDNITSLDSAPLGSLEILLTCEIADTYVDLQDYETAVEYYELAQEKCLTPSWAGIYQLLSKKIILTAQKIENSNIALKQLANISAISGNDIGQSLENLNLSNCASIDLDDEFPFVKLDVALFNSTFLDEVRVSDTLVTQLRIESTFDTSVLEKAVPGSKAKISLNYIDVKYENGNLIRLEGNGTQTTQLQVASMNDDGVEFNYLNFAQNPLFLQLHHEVTNTGSFLVSEVSVSSTVNVESNGKKTKINKNDVFVIDHHKIKHAFEVYSADENGKIRRKLKDLKGRNLCRVFVKPFRPNITILSESKPESVIIGEKFETPIKLTFPETSVSSKACKSVKLLVETIVYDDMIETKDLHAQVNWDLLKDDEPMELFDAMEANLRERKHNLHLRITKSPSSSVSKEAELKVVLYFKLIVASASGEITDFDVKSLLVEIIPNPFSHRLNISACAYNGSSPTIPNPFVLDGSSSTLSMPLISRSWLLQAQLQDTSELLQLGQISITQAKLFLRSTNPEITTSCLSEVISGKLSYSRLFLTTGKHRPATANVGLIAGASFVYKRKGSSVESSYETEEEEIDITLHDPRVLLQVYVVDGKVHLEYMIENPTSRIFTFSSALTTDKAMGQGTIWEFEDERNEAPLKLPITPVLPFSQHKIEYYGTYVDDSEKPELICLPQLEVHDMHYKVNLPTVALQSNVRVTESGMVIELEL